MILNTMVASNATFATLSRLLDGRPINSRSIPGTVRDEYFLSSVRTDCWGPASIQLGV